MKKLLLVVGVLGALALLVVVGVVGYAVWLVRQVDSPQFQQSLLDRASATVGTKVQVERMDVSLLSGITLDGVAVANPAPFEGELLTAESFVLRYRLRPLLSGRVEVERLALEKPVLRLVMDRKGAFNYEKLGGGAATPAPAQPKPSSGSAAAPIELLLKQLAVHGAAIVMQDAAGTDLLRIDDASLDTVFRVGASGATGAGKAEIALVDLGGTLFVRRLRSPIELSKESLRLAPIRGTLAGGEVSGEVKADLADFRFTSSLNVQGASVETLLQEAKAASTASGKLNARASFEGAGGLPTLSGSGEAEVADCRVKNARALLLLSKVLAVPELADPDFDQCTVEFRLARSRLHTPRLALTGRQVQLTGQGVVNLESSTLDYQMTLALGQPLLAKITARELRGAFVDRGDGFSTIDFRIYGSTLAPQTDLATRMGKAALHSAARSGLGRLFGKKK